MQVILRNAKLKFEIAKPVEFKNYITTSTDNDYIDLSSIVGVLSFKNLKIDIEFTQPMMANGTLFTSRNMYHAAYVNSGRFIMNVSNQSIGVTNDATITRCGLNATTKDYYIGSNSGVADNIGTTSQMQTLSIFSNTTKAGVFKIKSVVVANASNNEVILNLKPAINSDDKPCLYDTISKTSFFEVNGHTLVVE